MKLIAFSVIAWSIVSVGDLKIPHGGAPVRAVAEPALDERMREFFADLGTSPEGEALHKYFSRSREFRYVLTTHSARGGVGEWRFPAAQVGAAISGPLQYSFMINPDGQPVGLLVHQVQIRGRGWVRVRGNRYVPPGENSSSATYIQWTHEGGEWVISEIGDERFLHGRIPDWCC